jgi:cytochrome c5
MRAGLFPALIAVMAMSVLTGCSEPDKAGAIADPPRFDDPHLEAGRSTWMMTCRACHLTGVAGAPAVGKFDAWAPRLGKGRSALHASAVNGLRNESGWTMPPKGGNQRLSPQQVKAAVDYMLAAVTSDQPGVTIED